MKPASFPLFPLALSVWYSAVQATAGSDDDDEFDFDSLFDDEATDSSPGSTKKRTPADNLPVKSRSTSSTREKNGPSAADRFDGSGGDDTSDQPRDFDFGLNIQPKEKSNNGVASRSWKKVRSLGSKILKNATGRGKSDKAKARSATVSDFDLDGESTATSSGDDFDLFSSGSQSFDSGSAKKGKSKLWSSMKNIVTGNGKKSSSKASPSAKGSGSSRGKKSGDEFDLDDIFSSSTSGGSDSTTGPDGSFGGSPLPSGERDFPSAGSKGAVADGLSTALQNLPFGLGGGTMRPQGTPTTDAAAQWSADNLKTFNAVPTRMQGMNGSYAAATVNGGHHSKLTTGTVERVSVQVAAESTI